MAMAVLATPRRVCMRVNVGQFVMYVDVHIEDPEEWSMSGQIPKRVLRFVHFAPITLFPFRLEELASS
jgi:hypothetical protein